MLKGWKFKVILGYRYRGDLVFFGYFINNLVFSKDNVVFILGKVKDRWLIRRILIFIRNNSGCEMKFKVILNLGVV